MNIPWNVHGIIYEWAFHCNTMQNTSLAAKGALAYRLQRRTACKIKNGHQGTQKWSTGS